MNDVMNRLDRRTPPPPRAPELPPLPRDVLLAGAKFVHESPHRLSPDDAQFARGMVALLTEGRTLTPRQHDKLVLLTDSLLGNV